MRNAFLAVLLIAGMVAQAQDDFPSSTFPYTTQVDTQTLDGNYAPGPEPEMAVPNSDITLSTSSVFGELVANGMITVGADGRVTDVARGSAIENWRPFEVGTKTLRLPPSLDVLRLEGALPHRPSDDLKAAVIDLFGDELIDSASIEPLKFFPKMSDAMPWSYFDPATGRIHFYGEDRQTLFSEMMRIIQDSWDRYEIGGSNTTPSIGVTPINSKSTHATLAMSLVPAKDLRWNNSGEDISCYSPRSVDASFYQADIDWVRLSTVMVSAVGVGLAPSLTGDHSAMDVLSSSPCAKDGGHVAHCTGLLLPGGAAVVTAAHCINDFAVQLGLQYPKIQFGVNLCLAGDVLRFYLALDLPLDIPLRDYTGRGCASIIGLGGDMVEVRLSEPFVGYLDVADRYIREPDFEHSGWEGWSDVGRRLFGTGLPHGPLLVDVPGGRLVPTENCQIALDYMVSSGYGHSFDYACVSMDTALGSSGGPVFALYHPISRDSDDPMLLFLGTVSAAAFTDSSAECAPSGIPDSCEFKSSGLNLITLSPGARVNQLNILPDDFDKSSLWSMASWD